MRSVTVIAAFAGLVAASPMPHLGKLNVTGTLTRTHSVNLNVPAEMGVKARNATAKAEKPSSSPAGIPTWTNIVAAPSWTSAYTNATSVHDVGPDTPIATATSPVYFNTPTLAPYKPASGAGVWNTTAFQAPSLTPVDLPEPTATVTATVVPESLPTETSSPTSKPTGTKTRTALPTGTSVQVAVGHANGTFTDTVEVLIDVVNKLDGISSVSFIYLLPPSDDKTYLQVDCSYSSPSNATLGSVSVATPTTVPVVPASAVGFITCNFSD